MKNSNVPQVELNQEQVIHVIQFIDASQSEPVKDSIFSRLGRECFFSRHLDAWVEQYHGDVQAFLDRVNVQQASKYWEKLEFTADRKSLVLTGRKVEACACAFADCSEPPKALCQYCCKSMQQELFGMLLGRKVDVIITESALLGGERCSTLIKMVGE